MEALKIIQSKLKAPKGQYNSFGKYAYRSCEDILEAVKPLLLETNATLTLSDEIVAVGDRIYVKATATFTAGTESAVATAYAREPGEKKGMDSSQITGTASSYARKYALNGLFLIDDTKDADTDENRIQELVLSIEAYENEGLIKDEWKPKVEAYRKNKDVAGLEKIVAYCKSQANSKSA